MTTASCSSTLLKGVFCASVTPLNADLSIDHGLLATHAKKLLSDGCDGVAMLGTTGEATSFSTAERMAALEALLTAGIRPNQLVPGTGAASVEDSVALTKHALSCGVSHTLILPPFYYKTLSEDAIVETYSYILNRVDDDRLRVLLYHIPQMSGVSISVNVIARLRESHGDLIAGVKDSSADLANSTALIEGLPDFPVFVGSDPLMLPTLKIGGAGCITATSNFLAGDLAGIYNAFNDDNQSDWVNSLQSHITEGRRVTTQYAQIPSIKAVLAQIYNSTAWRAVRPPLLQLDNDKAAEVSNMLAAI
ncbi:dihydrodipicolinate synthase family protein [Halomonas sp. H2]|uniref:dihydrodipicolinate synthase family protein n=1 Tax=Halomonas sp. H2 TaxID=261936 RepID=UPI003CF4F89F